MSFLSLNTNKSSSNYLENIFHIHNQRECLSRKNNFENKTIKRLCKKDKFLKTLDFWIFSSSLASECEICILHFILLRKFIFMLGIIFLIENSILELSFLSILSHSPSRLQIIDFSSSFTINFFKSEKLDSEFKKI